jgi:hypothetical protein
LPVIADPEPDAMDASTRTDTDPTASDAGAAVPSDDPEVAALLGTWAMELHDARTTTTPIGEQSLRSTTWTLVQVVRREAEPEAIELRSTRCAVDMGQTAGLSLSVDPQVIRALGPTFSLDDFGTGYSSFAHIQRLPIGALKIDRSFVSQVNLRPDDATIVRAIITLAQSLRLDVVAEGVEQREQLEFLRGELAKWAKVVRDSGARPE